jgi:hypothetical protein
MNTRSGKGRIAPALVALIISVAIATSCQSPAADAPLEVSAFASTVWSDGVSPESTISFLDRMVVLDGEYWVASVEGNSLDGKSLAFNEASDLSGDAVEPAVQIWTNVADHACIELYYYKATATVDEHFDVYGWEQQRRRFFKKG